MKKVADVVFRSARFYEGYYLHAMLADAVGEVFFVSVFQIEFKKMLCDYFCDLPGVVAEIQIDIARWYAVRMHSQFNEQEFIIRYFIVIKVQVFALLAQHYVFVLCFVAFGAAWHKVWCIHRIFREAGFAEKVVQFVYVFKHAVGTLVVAGLGYVVIVYIAFSPGEWGRA